jgi:hypothetical protein
MMDLIGRLPAPQAPECSRLLGRVSRERNVRDALSVMTTAAAPPDPPPSARGGPF